jgi:3-deoxy-D-manno-octulosonate 8-phosphate phosphatase KdsC-like HAD superfamily phosphatase
LEKLCNDTGVSLAETAYIGDDVNDLSAIKIAGLSACPADAIDEVKENVDIVLNQNGGNGAVREWRERII